MSFQKQNVFTNTCYNKMQIITGDSVTNDRLIENSDTHGWQIQCFSEIVSKNRLRCSAMSLQELLSVSSICTLLSHPSKHEGGMCDCNYLYR